MSVVKTSTLGYQIPKGYKQTELGLIPEEWEVVRLGDCATFRTGPFGTALHKSDYTHDGVPVINPMHLCDGQIAPTRTMTVTEQAAKGLSEFRLKPDDIIMGRRGDMGRCAVVQPRQAGWLCGTGSVVIRPFDTDPQFLQRLLSSPRVIYAIEEASVGTTMVNLNHGTLAGLRLQFPPFHEQRLIATALSDVDALLGALVRLIAKKRDLKQAAMQQLLTAQTRLPGFHCEWEEMALGDVVQTDPENLSSTTAGGYRFNYISLEDVDCGVLVGATELEFCTAPSRARRKLRPGDVLVSTVRPNLMSHLKFPPRDGEWVCSTGFCVLRCDPKVISADFVFQHLFGRTINKQIDALLTGSNYPAINSSDVRSLVMPFPKIAEQTAIADILMDMDAEIVTLEQRREKTHVLKQGMMQELLTGRTRLV